MTVYYFEETIPIVAPLTIESNEPVFSADTVSLKQQRASQGAQRWELSFQIQTKDIEEDYFVGIVTGITSAKSMPMPQLLSVDKKVTATNAGVPNTTPSGSSAVPINFNEAGKFLPKGSFIKFSNHSKIYMVTANVTTQTSAVTVPIYPSLKAGVTTSHLVYHPGSSVKPTLQYYRDLETLQGIIYEDGVLVNPGTIKLIEAF
jgi:hypothetical protein